LPTGTESILILYSLKIPEPLLIKSTSVCIFEENPVAMSENVLKRLVLSGSQEYDILFPMVLPVEFVYQIGVTCFTSGIEQFVS